MRIVLSHIHDQFMWLNAPIKITKDVLHIVTGYPIGDSPKDHKQTDKNKLCKLTQEKWDGGLKLSTIDDPELRFAYNVISY